MPEPNTSRVVEVAGRNWLVSQLLGRQLQIATPEVDQGIDLIVFDEVGGRGIKALPLQLKCSRQEAFSLDKKYEGRGIPIVYIWHVFTRPEAYVVTYEEALEVLGERSANSDSFAQNGYYVSNTISKARRAAMTDFRNRWTWIIDRVHGQLVSGLALEGGGDLS